MLPNQIILTLIGMLHTSTELLQSTLIYFISVNKIN